MTPAKPLDMNDYPPDSVVALIHARDSAYVAPIREYLESKGCYVCVNAVPGVKPAYQIACGDAQFVKQIFEDQHVPGAKRLAIMWNTEQNDGPDLSSQKIKSICIDPIPLTSGLVHKIFSFFFMTKGWELDLSAGTKRVFDPKRQEHTPLQFKAVEKEEDVTIVPVAVQNVVHRNERVLDDKDKKRIAKTIAEVFSNNRQFSVPTKNTKKGSHRFGMVFFFLFLFLTPGLWYGLCLMISIGSLSVGVYAMTSHSLSTATLATKTSLQWASISRGALAFLSVPFRVISFYQPVAAGEMILSIVTNVAEAQLKSIDVAGVAQDFGTDVVSELNGKTVDSASLATKLSYIRTEVPFIVDRLGLAAAELSVLVKSNIFPFQNSWVRQQGEYLVAALNSVREEIGFVDTLLSLYPGIGGFTGKQTYLLLFQNSMELRPTGGFIGSVGLVTFLDGAIAQFSIQDVYALDGQLRGHVNPPGAIRELVGQEHWYLRDSNWDPDFGVSGQAARFFYEKETGVSVDGVVAVNTPLLVDVLSVLGPIDLPDYNDRITADNFFGKSLHYVQSNFFPGSTQKADFLGSVSTALLAKVTGGEQVYALKLMHVMRKALLAKNLQLYLSDSTLASQIAQSGWSGTYPQESRCLSKDTTPCVSQVLGMIEANVSVNKVNYFVSRRQETEITVSPDGNTTTSTAFVYTNSSSETSTSEGGGVYRTYSRIYVPKTAKLLAVTLNGTPVPIRNDASGQLYPLPYIESLNQHSDEQVLGIAFEVSPKSEMQLQISLSDSTPLPVNSGPFVYELRQPKQAGVEGMSRVTTIHYPKDWLVTPIYPLPSGSDFLANKLRLTYNTTVSTDETIRLQVEGKP